MFADNELARLLCAVPHQYGFNLKQATTMGVGGKAELAVFPRTEFELIRVASVLQNSGKSIFILGNGSNVVANDGYIEKVLICTKRLCFIRRDAQGIELACGINVGEILKFFKAEKIGGFELLHGIPATLGGLVFMNASANGVSVSDNINCVTALDLHDNCKKVRLSKGECRFGYRESVFNNNRFIIVSATFNVNNSSINEIERNVARAIQARRRQPQGRSAGCIFKNGSNYFAAKLIDDCGLKGARMGGAVVSDKHANFIINDSNASGTDVVKLIDLVKQTVRIKTEIELKEEVIYLGS